MKFKLTTTSSGYPDGDHEILKLKQLGFKFEKIPNGNGYRYPRGNFFVDIEFETLKELVEFTKKWGEVIIYGNELEIYNGYRE